VKSLALGEEHRLAVLEDRALKIFESKVEKFTKG
jgi:hypothetical protein